MEKGIVRKVIKGKEWSSEHGAFDVYDISIENEGGVILEGSTMTKQGNPCKFVLNQPCQFTKEDKGKYGFRFKWASEGFKGGKNNFDPEQSVRQSAYNGIIQLVCHGKLDIKDITRELIDATSDKIRV